MEWHQHMKEIPPPLPEKTITSITTCMTRIPGWQKFFGESSAKVTFPTEVLGEGLIFNLQFINWENGYLFITRQSLFPVHVLHIHEKGPNMKASLFNWYTKTVVSSLKHQKQILLHTFRLIQVEHFKSNDAILWSIQRKDHGNRSRIE